MNYSELLDNVRNYTEVTSDVLSNTVINVFLVNIENQMSDYSVHGLRTLVMAKKDIDEN